MSSLLYPIRHAFRVILVDKLSVNYRLYRLYINYKKRQIRKKNKINVLFVLAELSTWKTECLYKEMLKHERFNPILAVAEYPGSPELKQMLIDYILQKGYQFVDIDDENTDIDRINPDLIFYYKPYGGCYNKKHWFTHHLKSVPCSINYGFLFTYDREYYYNQLFVASMFYFAENEVVRQRMLEINGFKSQNVVATGSPIQDIFLQPLSNFSDPWKNKDGRKRIIYSPHHSLEGTNGNGIEYASFLKYGEQILELAKKYKDKIYFAFKPHPLLYKKLEKVWGANKTADYYRQWDEMENSQLEVGEYYGLFMHSDALINDSCTFIVEYLFSNKPSLFLFDDNEKEIEKDMTEYGKAGLDCSIRARNLQDVETFIVDVINGKDSYAANRRAFIQRYMTPPNGITASQNIITTILGVSPYNNI